jgi:hypothetical protein
MSAFDTPNYPLIGKTEVSHSVHGTYKYFFSNVSGQSGKRKG